MLCGNPISGQNSGGGVEPTSSQDADGAAAVLFAREANPIDGNAFPWMAGSGPAMARGMIRIKNIVTGFQ
jgi:hypothetical protein